MRIIVKAAVTLAATVSVPGILGGLTPQPKSVHPNGFPALAAYAAPATTGNVIDSLDAIAIPKFSNL